MNISRSTIWFGLRSCLYCGSFVRRSEGLCDFCSEELWSWQGGVQGSLFQQQVHKLEVLSLFQWIPGRQEILSRLVHALKGNHGAEIWSFYAEEFQRRRISEGKESARRPLLFIPSPAKTKSQDHATFFAKGLASACGGELVFCLLRENMAGQQKEKSRNQRHKTKLCWTEKFTKQEFVKISAGKQIVFVDDVLTTGSTALAAWKTLGKPRDFAVWTLAQRGLSCGASKSLI